MPDTRSQTVAEISVPKSMEIRCKDHFDSVSAFAQRTGRVADLQKNLDRLGSWGDRGFTVVLYKDFALHSFGFQLEKDRKVSLVGGLIFHGNHDGGGDGGAPTYSVNLTPVDGWSIHT